MRLISAPCTHSSLLVALLQQHPDLLHAVSSAKIVSRLCSVSSSRSQSRAVQEQDQEPAKSTIGCLPCFLTTATTFCNMFAGMRSKKKNKESPGGAGSACLKADQQQQQPGGRRRDVVPEALKLPSPLKYYPGTQMPMDGWFHACRCGRIRSTAWQYGQQYTSLLLLTATCCHAPPSGCAAAGRPSQPRPPQARWCPSAAGEAAELNSLLLSGLSLSAAPQLRLLLQTCLHTALLSPAGASQAQHARARPHQRSPLTASSTTTAAALPARWRRQQQQQPAIGQARPPACLLLQPCTGPAAASRPLTHPQRP